MKKALLILFGFSMLSPVAGFGQIIDSLKIEYSNPGINNDAEVIAFLTIGSSPAWRINYASTITNDTLYLTSCYYSGALTAMSYLTDTLRVGTIPPTIRGLHFRIYGASDPNICDTTLYIKHFFSFAIQNPTGISADTQNRRIEIYPNPVTDMLHISGNLERLNLYDLRGKLIKRYDFSAQNPAPVSVAELSPGIYVAEQISRTGKISRRRLVKK